MKAFFKPTAKIQLFFKLYKDFTKKVIFFAFSVRFHNHQIVFHSEITLKILGGSQVGCGWFNGNSLVHSVNNFKIINYTINQLFRHKRIIPKQLPNAKLIHRESDRHEKHSAYTPIGAARRVFDR